MGDAHVVGRGGALSGRGVVLLSGGLDSTVLMAIAADEHRSLVALTFDYGQRHHRELEAAAAVAAHYGAERLLVSLDTSRWGGSALTDLGIAVPRAGETPAGEIPVTYVPARNVILLSVALGVAEARDAETVWIGVNALDYSGYPDCRPAFIDAMQVVAKVGQKRGVEGRPVRLRSPLITLRKSQIVRLGVDLHAPLRLSWSCYRGGAAPCGDCDACRLRALGFEEAGVDDPALSAR